MDIFIKLNAEVGGKDKVARLLQYSCRLFWDSLDARKERNLFLIHELKTLEYLLSSFRKCKSDNLCEEVYASNHCFLCFVSILSPLSMIYSAEIWKVNRNILWMFEDCSLQ
jgi:hypothetical protein